MPPERPSHPCLMCRKARWRHTYRSRVFVRCIDELPPKATMSAVCASEDPLSLSVQAILKSQLPTKH